MNLDDFCTAHYETARGFAVHFLRGQFDHVDDVVQTTFVNICRDWKPTRQGTWEEKSQVMWLYTIVYHACIDHARKVRRQQNTFSPLEEWVAAPDQMERTIEQQELVARTWVQLREIDQKALVSLLEGYKPRDTAQSEGYKKRRWVARKAFRQIWQQVNAA